MSSSYLKPLSSGGGRKWASLLFLGFNSNEGLLHVGGFSEYFVLRGGGGGGVDIATCTCAIRIYRLPGNGE